MELFTSVKEIVILEVQRRTYAEIPRRIGTDHVATDTLGLCRDRGNITIQQRRVPIKCIEMILNGDILQSGELAESSIGRSGMLHRIECTWTYPDTTRQLLRTDIMLRV